MATQLGRETRHFDFGRNWSEYSRRIDDAAIASAKRGLDRLCLNDLAGKTFLDIGCGSGIHALGAAQRGAIVTAIDFDADSVATTNATLERGGFASTARQLSVFDATPEALGQFDIVYSWGVLHHTGDVWGAIDAAARLVAPGGTLAIALYEETRLCRAWTLIKRAYSKMGSALRAPIKYAFGTALLLRHAIRRRQSPLRYLRGYHRDRGMDFWHDADDWLGGYPYQSTRAKDVVAYLEERGFVPHHVASLKKGTGLFGAGCSEYNLTKRHVSKSGTQ